MKSTNPADYQKMSLEELGQAYLEAVQAEEEATNDKKGIGQELQLRMQEEKQDGFMVDNMAISKVKMTRYNTSLEDARKVGAIKMTEQVDTAILKKLDNAGTEIPGKTVIEYLKVTEVKDDE